jgi:hypothetical protein
MPTSTVRWLLSLLALLLLILIAPRPLRAHPSYRVVVLRPPSADEITSEALARVQGELAAAGFEVIVLNQSGQSDARTVVETAGAEIRPIAAFAIFGRPAASEKAWEAEIWVSDRIANRTTMQTMQVDLRDRARGATVLAVQAVELLKASLADLWVEPSKELPERSSAPRAPEPRNTSPSADRSSSAPMSTLPTSSRMPTTGFGVHAGVALIENPEGIGPSFETVVKLSYGDRAGLAGRLTVSGFGTSISSRAEAGTVRIGQKLALLELVAPLGPVARFTPLVDVGVGAYGVEIDGVGSPPYQGRSETAWSLLTAIGGGVALSLGSRLAWITEAQGLLAFPQAVVRIGDSEVGRMGRPSLLFSTGIVGAL